jgi:hypothetical protein
MSNHNDWTRRDALKAGLSTLLATTVTGAEGAEGGTVAVGLVLRETAGLRRFGFPVHTLLPGDLPGRNARLLREGRPVDAQFRRVAGRTAARRWPSTSSPASARWRRNATSSRSATGSSRGRSRSGRSGSNARAKPSG